MVEHLRYTQKQFGVDTFSFENGVNVGAFAADLCSKPRDTTPLAAEFVSYKFPNVNVGLHKQKNASENLLNVEALG